MKTHTCTSEELGLEGTNSSFLPVEKKNVAVVKSQQKKLLCVDHEDMQIYGDYNSNKARIINIQLEICNDGGYFAEKSITCKSPAEITQFLRNKYFVMLYNEKRFDSAVFTNKSIVDESKLLWMPINTQMR